jgi:hypothetical protein
MVSILFITVDRVEKNIDILGRQSLVADDHVSVTFHLEKLHTCREDITSTVVEVSERLVSLVALKDHVFLEHKSIPIEGGNHG